MASIPHRVFLIKEINEKVTQRSLLFSLIIYTKNITNMAADSKNSE